MSVKEILKGKGGNVITATRDATLTEIAKLLGENRIGALVVMDSESDDARVCGIISERDVVRAIHDDPDTALASKVSSAMTSSVISCTRSDSVDTLMNRMTEGRFRHLPVIEDDKLIGIVSIGDVVKRKIEQAERDAEDLKRYIAS